jgi:tetratricopeptide (TPR) repeat protein
MTTDQQLVFYQDKLRNAPDAASYASLGLAYLQKVREVSDPSYYTKAEAVFNKAMELDPKNIEAMEGLGSLALSRHQFAQALDWGLKAQKLKPQAAYEYGVLTDAYTELGRYDEAVQALQTMVDLHPDVSSYARISYQRELHGQYEAAVTAMKQAVLSRGPAPENEAWVTYQLGLLYFNHNQLDLATSAFQQSLTLIPDYVYGLQGMARIKVAQADYNSAVELYTKITQRMPIEQFIIEFGDLYNLMGKTSEADRQYELVRSIDKLYQANGVDTDVEMALFNADHDYNLPDALQHAQQEYKARPSIKAADVLAWTLYKTGDYKAANEAEQQALRLGMQDGLYYYHAALINSKLGQTEQARSYLEKTLTLNPNFSMLYSNDARKMLTQLGGAVAVK